MEAKIAQFFDSVGSFFSGGDKIPCCDSDIIHACEKEVNEVSESGDDERVNESIMRLSWALVHSRKNEDVQRGIAMLESALGDVRSPLQQREKLYLLAVGYYKIDDCAKSRHILDQCLEIAPDWSQALTLKKTVEDKIAKDGVIGIGITAGAVGLAVLGIVAAVARRA